MNTINRDTSAITHIRTQVKEYNGDECLSALIERCFSWMFEEKEDNGCLIQSVALYITMCDLGYNPEIYYGMCTSPSGQRFYHAWLELEGKVIDIAIYGNLRWSPYIKNTADILPVVLVEYQDAPCTYEKFYKDNEWPYAGVAIVEVMDMFEYIDKAPYQCVRKRIRYIANKSKIKVENMIQRFSHRPFRLT